MDFVLQLSSTSIEIKYCSGLFNCSGSDSLEIKARDTLTCSIEMQCSIVCLQCKEAWADTGSCDHVFPTVLVNGLKGDVCHVFSSYEADSLKK